MRALEVDEGGHGGTRGKLTVADPNPEHLHRPGDLHPGDEGRLLSLVQSREQAGAGHRVDGGDSRGRDADQYLAGARCGVREVDGVEHLGSPISVETDGMHA